MSITFKEEFDGKTIEYRKTGHIESIRLRSSLTRRVKSYREDEDEKIEMEDDEYMADLIEVLKPLFVKYDFVDSYEEIYDEEESRNKAYGICLEIHGHMYMDVKKKVSSKNTQQREPQVSA